MAEITVKIKPEIDWSEVDDKIKELKDFIKELEALRLYKHASQKRSK